MDKIKKRITKAIEQLQLADNEMERQEILGKPISLDSDAMIMLVQIEKLTRKLTTKPVTE